MKKIASLLLLLCITCSAALAGKVDTITIHSNAMNKDIRCIVITPDHYKKRQKLPVVYLLHGYSGAYDNWITKVPALKTLVDQYRLMIVCPDGGFGSWYIDSPLDPSIRYETYVAREVPAYIEQHYSTINDREHRAITGLSMGGHGALYLAIRHRDYYGAAGSMSGGVDFRPFPNNWDLKKVLGDYDTHRQAWDDNVVVNLVDSLKNHELQITFECGVKDFFITVNRQLHQKLLQLNIDHDYTERPGAHTWDYWGNAIAYQLLFFHNFFEKGTAKPAQQ